MRHTNIAIGRARGATDELDVSPIYYCYQSSILTDLKNLNGILLQPFTNGTSTFVQGEQRGSIFINELHPLFNAAVIDNLDWMDAEDVLLNQIHFTFSSLKNHIVDIMPREWIERMTDK